MRVRTVLDASLQRADRAAGRLLRPMPGGWWLDAVLLACFALLTAALTWTTPLLDLDVAVADWCDAHRPHWADVVVQGLNRAGQGGWLLILCLVLAGWLSWKRRSVRPLILVAATYLSIICLVLPPKLFSDRAAPSAEGLAHPEKLFAVSHGMSYPSGHVVNALVWYTTLLILLGAVAPGWLRWSLRTVPLPLVVFATTYLGWHWLSDDVAAVFLGLVLTRGVLRVRWDSLPLPRWVARAGWDRPAGLDREPGSRG